MKLRTVTTQTLRPGDKISIGPGPYSTATVTKIVPAVLGSDEQVIHLVRPYIHFDEATGIEYIGVENWSMSASPRELLPYFKWEED